MADANVSFTVDLSAIDRALEEPLRAWLQGRLSAVASNAFHRAPESKSTPIHPMSRAPQIIPGKLKHSINTRIEGTGTRLIGYVEATAPYAKFVHEGTGAHPIRPRKPAFALAFWWEKKGDFEVNQGVNHPGTRPQPFLRDALVAVMG